MANPDTRIIKSKTCRRLAEVIKDRFDNDCTELACAAISDILADEQIEESPDGMLICTEESEVMFSLIGLAERLVRAVGDNISEFASRLGDEIAETVEC